MGLRHYKKNNTPRVSERAFQFTFEDDKVSVGTGDLAAIAGIEDNAPMHRRIVTYLENNGGPVTVNDLANTLISTPGYVRTVLNRELKDKVQCLAGGRWGLAYHDAYHLNPPMRGGVFKDMIRAAHDTEAMKGESDGRTADDLR